MTNQKRAGLERIALAQDELRRRTIEQHYRKVIDTMAIEAERMHKALKEIELRTRSYRGNYDEWPLVAGVHHEARVGLGETS